MKTKINAYLCFGGNCADAMKFYDKAFGTKHEACHYKDAPPCDEMPLTRETENYVMHGAIKLDEGQELFFCDVPNAAAFNSAINVSLAFDTEARAKAVFKALAVGGKITQPIGKVFWSACYGSVTDKFGVNWMVTVL